MSTGAGVYRLQKGSKMKVYQLMSLLETFPAGAEVVVAMCSTLNAELVTVDHCDDGLPKGQVVITGGDAELISEDGDTVGFLSELAAVKTKKR